MNNDQRMRGLYSLGFGAFGSQSSDFADRCARVDEIQALQRRCKGRRKGVVGSGLKGGKVDEPRSARRARPRAQGKRPRDSQAK